MNRLDNPQVDSNSFEAFLPDEMARRAEEVGVKKANLPFEKLLLLSILAGAFIALGAVFSTTVTASNAQTIPFGINRLIGGVSFSLGLILVVVAGAELFTGNNLVIMAFASGRVSIRKLLGGWCVVYVGNFVGAFATAWLVLMSNHHALGAGAVGLNAVMIASTKCSLHPLAAFFSGIMCNALVCLAVWLCYSCRTTSDKILAIIFPITAFVAAGFEHCVANMYFVPMGILLKDLGPGVIWEQGSIATEQLVTLNWSHFILTNLIPVTLGNIVGGAGLVGLVYWRIHVKK